MKINDLKKVVLLNEGVGDKDSFIKISSSYKSDAGSILKNFERGKKIKINSLESIVRIYNLKNAVLKMDCDGCEYSVILNADLLTLTHLIRL